jgi:Uma2 family endonuclease
MALIYAEAGVEEYWIVDAAGRRIEIYRNPAQGRYQNVSSVGEGQIAECGSLPGFKVDVAELFYGISL